MKSYKANGLVLKSVKLGEADKIVTLLTTEGRVSAVAKGIRRTGSKFGGRLEPGNDLAFVLAKGRNLDTVTQVHIERVRPGLRTDLAKVKAVFAVLELADKLAMEKDQDFRLLGLVSATLDQLEDNEGWALLLLAYDLKAVAISGFLPNFSECVLCGSKDGLVQQGIKEGGLVCRTCYSGQNAIKTNKAVLELIDRLLKMKMVDVASMSADSESVSLAGKMIWTHIRYHVHASFKTRVNGGLIE